MAVARVDEYRSRGRTAVLARYGATALILFALTGCGSSGSSAKSNASTGEASDSSTPTNGLATSTTGVSATDQALVNTLVLTPPDLPGTWQSGPIHPNDPSGDAQVTACLGIPNSDYQETRYAGSHEFRRATLRVFSQATAYTSVNVVKSDLRGALKPQLTDCIAKSLEASDAATNPRVSKIALPASAGALDGFRVSGNATVSTSTGSQQFSFDQVALAKGRIEVNIDILSLGGTAPAGLMDQLTRAIAQRLDKTAT